MSATVQGQGQGQGPIAPPPAAVPVKPEVVDANFYKVLHEAINIKSWITNLESELRPKVEALLGSNPPISDKSEDPMSGSIVDDLLRVQNETRSILSDLESLINVL